MGAPNPDGARGGPPDPDGPCFMDADVPRDLRGLSTLCSRALLTPCGALEVCSAQIYTVALQVLVEDAHTPDEKGWLELPHE